MAKKERIAKKDSFLKYKWEDGWIGIPRHILQDVILSDSQKILLAYIYWFGIRGCWEKDYDIGQRFGWDVKKTNRIVQSLLTKDKLYIKSPGSKYRTLWAKCHPSVQKAEYLLYMGKKWLKPPKGVLVEKRCSPRNGSVTTPRASKLLPQKCPSTDINKVINRDTKIEDTSPSPLPADGAGSGDASGGSMRDVYEKMQPQELLAAYESRPYDKTYIDRKCPELIEKARQMIA